MVQGWDVKVRHVRQMQMGLAQVLRKPQHREIPYRKRQEAQKESSQKIGCKDRIQHVKETLHPLAGGETSPADAIPSDP